MHRVNCIDIVSSSSILVSLVVEGNDNDNSFVLLAASFSIFFSKLDPLKKFDNDSMPDESSLFSVDDAEETPEDDAGDENRTKFVVRVLSLPLKMLKKRCYFINKKIKLSL